MADAQAFRREWEGAGPMVVGLDPMEAMDRLRKFQQMLEVGGGAGAGDGLGDYLELREEGSCKEGWQRC